MPLFKGRRREPGPPLELLPVVDRWAEVLPRLEDRPVDPDLVRARLADAYRDARLIPAPPAVFTAATRDLDEEAWRRLTLVVTAFEDQGARASLAALQSSPEVQVRDGLAPLVRETRVLTVQVLSQSELRVEELARRFALRLGFTISGEAERESADRLEALDYARLLAQAERAKISAEDRLEYLKKLQDAELERRRPRGKW